MTARRSNPGVYLSDAAARRIDTAKAKAKALPVKDLEWHQVEVRRLEEILKRVIKERDEWMSRCDQLNVMLGQASAGMELADLIKRMTS
jgi:hypothetical protein